jgi:hypothetical protein
MKNFRHDELFSFVLKDIELDNSEQEPDGNIFNVMKLLVLHPFSSSESQVEKSKSIQEQFNQLNHEEGTSIFVEKPIILHIFMI